MSPELIAFLGDMWRLVQAAGAVLCVVFGYLLRLEREERREEQARNWAMVEAHRAEKELLTERAVSAINSITVVVQGLKEIIQSGGRAT